MAYDGKLKITQAEAIRFLETACRNWMHVPRLSNDDIEDVRVELQRFRTTSAAPLVEALKAIAAEASVPLDDLPDHDQPNGWRKVAIERINIARAALAQFRGEVE